MKTILAAFICTAAIIGQIGTASAQYYYYGSPAGIFLSAFCSAAAIPRLELLPMGHPPASAVRLSRSRSKLPVGLTIRSPNPWAMTNLIEPTGLANGRLVCAHRNYRPIDGLCQRAW